MYCVVALRWSADHVEPSTIAAGVSIDVTQTQSIETLFGKNVHEWFFVLYDIQHLFLMIDIEHKACFSFVRICDSGIAKQ